MFRLRIYALRRYMLVDVNALVCQIGIHTQNLQLVLIVMHIHMYLLMIIYEYICICM